MTDRMVRLCRFVLLSITLAVGSACAGEFLIFDRTFVFDETLNGFNWFMPPDAAPKDWTSPDDYERGQVYTRFEIFSQPTNAASKLQFGIWQDGGKRETMSPHCELRGPGDVDGDGDIDIVSKTWRSGIYPDSANAGNAHADYLENRAIVKPAR